MIELDRRLRDAADRDGISRLVVGAVVHDGDRVLVLRRSSIDSFMAGIEELPSGKVEDGEDLRAALARELAEEIGRTAPVTVDPDFVTWFDYQSGSGRETRQYTFGVPHDGSYVRLSVEHTGFRWVPADRPEDSEVTDQTAQAVRDWAARSPR